MNTATKILLLQLSLSACGADESAVQKALETNQSDSKANYSEAVKLYSELPDCDKQRENQLVLVESENKLYVCKNKKWNETEIEGDKGDKGDKGEKGDKGSDGDDGEQGEQGIQGAQGSQGVQGIQGIQGVAGQDGEDHDAMYLSVSSATLASIETKPAGTKIAVYFTGSTTITHSASLSLIGTGNYVTSAGDLFEFVSLGSGNWKELSRSVENDSYLRASRISNQQFSYATWATLVFDSVIKDTQTEYSSGVFTAKQKGVYTITVNLMTASHAWVGGNKCGIAILHNDNMTALDTSVLPDSTQRCGASASKTLELAVGDTVKASVYIERSGTTNLEYSAEYNSISIVKIR